MVLGSALRSRRGLLLIHKSITVFLNFALLPNSCLCLEIITLRPHLIMLNVILVLLYKFPVVNIISIIKLLDNILVQLNDRQCYKLLWMNRAVTLYHIGPHCLCLSLN